MCNYLANLYFISDGWGSSRGGINAFNYDLCNALGNLSKQYKIKIYCVCNGTVPIADKKFALAQNVEILSVDTDDFNECNFSSLENNIDRTSNIFWIGHDVITGQQAISCQKHYGGRIVIFHHMDYEAYYSAKSHGQAVREKIDLQKNLLEQANYLVAVGPKLYDSLCDKFPDNKIIKFGSVVPGLASINPIHGVIRRTRLIATGRIEENNDCIKQFELLVKAFSKLVKDSEIAPESSITLIGLAPGKEQELEKNFKSMSCGIANGFSNVICLPYTTNREKLFKNISESSIVLMPSLSEGFGLVGLEAIAAGVPLILTQNSGLYQFLNDNNMNGYVDVVKIRGYVDNNVNETDVQEVFVKLKEIIKNIVQRKNRALELRDKLIQMGVTWESAAVNFLNIIDILPVSDIALHLISFVNPVIFNKNEKLRKSIVDIACTCLNEFVNKIEQRYAIDKKSILSLKIDKFDDIIYSIMRVISQENESSETLMKQITLQKEFLALVDDFLAKVVSKVKDTYADMAEICMDQQTKIINEENIYGLKNSEPNPDDVFPFWSVDRSFKEGLKNIIESARISSVLRLGDEDILESYHNQLIEQNKYLDFEGLAIMISNDALRIPINNVFATMNLRYQTNRKTRQRFLFDEISSERQISELLKNKRNIILGDPGSGKSTLMKKLILDMCSKKDREQHSIAQMCVSVQISAFSNWLFGGQIKTEKGTRSDLLNKFIEERLLKIAEDKVDILSLYNRLKGVGGIIYFIDGLDEVKNAQEKDEVKKHISELIDQTPQSVFIITSRIVGFDTSYESLGFSIAELQPLSQDAINQYIFKWYKVIGKFYKSDNREEYLKQKSEKLVSSIKNERSLNTLARNPLLLSILVILNYHGVSLPNNKVKLYEAISETLLRTWIEKRGLIEEQYDVEYMTGFFSEVAYEIIKNNYDTMLISEMTLKSIYVDYINERIIDKPISIKDKCVSDFIGYISESVGILLNKGRGINGEPLYGFLMHRQFTEYYAAIELEGMVESKERHLQEIIFDSKWIEVFTLMGCFMSSQMKGGKKRINKLLENLLNLKAKPIQDFEYNLQIVLRLLANNVFIEVAVKEKLRERLELIFESKNHYKILQFCSEFINVLGGMYQDFFCRFLKDMLRSNNYICVRNACIVINGMYKRLDLCNEILKEQLQPDSVIYNAFSNLIEKEQDIKVFFSRDYCYFHALFMANFIEYANKITDDFYLIDANRNNISKLISFFADGEHLRINSSQDDSEKNIVNAIIERSKRFTRKEIADEYLIECFLQNFAYEIATGNVNELSIINSYSGDLGGISVLIESAKNLSKIPMPDNSINYITWIGGDFRIYHYKAEDKHNFIIFILDRDCNELLRYEFAVKNKFTIQDIRDELNKNSFLSKKSRMQFSCLYVMQDLSMTENELYDIFNLAYNDNYILDNYGWRKELIKKINEDENVFYKMYDELIYRGIFRRVEHPNLFKGLLKIYLDIFSQKHKAVSQRAKNLLIKQYNETEEGTKKYVLYDIINKISNPFNSIIQETLLDDFDF